MAVQAQHLNFFNTPIEVNINPYNCYGVPLLSGTTTETFLPVYNYNSATDAGVANTFPSTSVVKADSGLTYPHHLPVSRKRSRDSVNPMTTCQIQNGNRCSLLTFMGEDVSLQLQQQQLEMDLLIAQHNDEMTREIEERRKQYSRRIIAAVEEGMIKRLKAKDDEIVKMTKFNWALQERVKSLSVEGQIWRDLAHTNEATVQTLRSNIENLLSAQINNNQHHNNDVAVLEAQSCCGSNYREEEGEECGTRGADRKCRHCGEGESSVLVLPCRHLCLCTICGSSVHTCPVCKTRKNASMQVIMSS